MKLSFSRLGTYGRLGNSMFQIAGTLGMAEKYGAKACFPQWAYEQYFTTPLPHGTMQALTIREKQFNHYDWNITTSADLLGYMQSEKYFPSTNPFTFKPSFLNAVKAKMPPSAFAGDSIVMQIRRGDYVTNPNYYPIPVTYYISALLTHFANWQQQPIIIVSDDMPWCRIHFECLPNVHFTDHLSDIEQMALATMAHHFIIPNSTFGWWCAWLGQKPHSKIIHPGHLHAGPLAERSNPADFYPKRWTSHQLDSYKIDLPDVTFTIPVFFDHADRRRNLNLSVCLLQQHFNTNTIVGEQGSQAFGYTAQFATYIHFAELTAFHRTRMLNQMATTANTPIVVNWDCDVFIPPMQIVMAVAMLRSGAAQMVFPYDGRFARLNRQLWFKKIEQTLDLGSIGNTDLRGKNGRPIPTSSVGGAVMFNTKAFVEGGMENEHMISYGPEDCERNDRFKMLGYKVERTGGTLYHMDHWIGPNSSSRHPHFKANNAELDKIREMNAEQLRSYVNTWPWLPAQ